MEKSKFEAKTCVRNTVLMEKEKKAPQIKASSQGGPRDGEGDVGAHAPVSQHERPETKKAPESATTKADVTSDTRPAAQRDSTQNKQGASKGDAKINVYGYARVSARDQNLSRQIDALRTFPVSERNIYLDKASGKDFKRPGYRRLIRRIRPGDVLVVKSIDRLGRNYAEILREWRILTEDRRAAIVVLDMPLLDTRAVRGDVTGAFIADMMLQLLSYIAQIERDNTRQRQAEGIAAAQARGVRFGRPRIERPECYEEVRTLYVEGEITRAQAAERLGVCMRTFDTWMKNDADAQAGETRDGLHEKRNKHVNWDEKR